MQIAKIRNLLTVTLLACLTAGCSGDLNAIKEGFDEKPQTYEAMMKAANEFAQAGNLEKAMYWYHNAMTNAEMEFGPGDGRVANAAMYDAAIARSANKLGEAEEMYKRAYQIQLKLAGPAGAKSPAVQDVAKAYAETLVANYKLEEARKIYPQVKTPQDNLKAAPRLKARKH